MPSNHLSAYARFIGVWNTTGEVLGTDASPAGRLVATDTYRWLPGAQFIVHDVDARFDGKPTRSMEVIGYDRDRRRHFAQSFDDQGVTERFTVSLHGRRWNILGAKVRFRGGFSAGNDRLTGLWELRGARHWQPWINLELVRVG